MANTHTVYDEYKITNAHVKWKGEEKSEKLGCTGSLETETEMRTVTKRCEGEDVFNVDIPVKMTAKLSAHLPVEILRRVWGLKTDGLKEGVFSYGTDSRQGSGVITFDTLDIFEEIKKLLAFPNATFTGGLKWSRVNGQEEIAEIETTFSSMKDANKQFYYEAFESDVTDQSVIEQWHSNFTPELVAETTP